MAPRLSAVAAWSAGLAALAAALLLVAESPPGSARSILVRAPGDPGKGGHNIGGPSMCSYAVDEASGLPVWQCPPPEETLAAPETAADLIAAPPPPPPARGSGLLGRAASEGRAAHGARPQMLKVEIEKYGAAGCDYDFDPVTKRGSWTCPPTPELPAPPEREVGNPYFEVPTPRMAQMAQRRPRARRARLFSFGTSAPPGGYAYAYNVPSADLYNEDNLGALPPSGWGENYDGKNFVAFYPEEQDMTGLPSYAHLDGDYWESVHGGVPTPLPFDLDEGGDGGPIYSDDSWNTNIWCPSGVCDYTSDSTPGAFDIDNYGAPVGYRPL
jgi:hypothetical protein